MLAATAILSSFEKLSAIPIGSTDGYETTLWPRASCNSTRQTSSLPPSLNSPLLEDPRADTIAHNLLPTVYAYFVLRTVHIHTCAVQQLDTPDPLIPDSEKQMAAPRPHSNEIPTEIRLCFDISRCRQQLFGHV